MHPILLKLRDGDLRSVGLADEVAEEIASDPELFEVVFEGMFIDDPVIRMRAADAVEKATRDHPELLVPHRKALLRQAPESPQQEVRWHVAQMLPRLTLGDSERAMAVDILQRYLVDRSRIVRANAVQALAELAQQDERFLPVVLPIIHEATQADSPAVRARARKVLAALDDVR